MTKKNGNVHQFSIIRYRGQPNKATTLGGYSVERQEQVFVDEPGWNVFVKVAQYDDHFIYESPEYKLGKIGHQKYLCTCGASGVVVGYSAFKKDASFEKALIVCQYERTYGHHATGGSRWI